LAVKIFKFLQKLLMFFFAIRLKQITNLLVNKKAVALGNVCFFEREICDISNVVKIGFEIDFLKTSPINSLDVKR
jgi:hypothetical protein